MNLIRAYGRGRGRKYATANSKFAAAARAALQERPKLADELETPSHLVVLASLHPHHDPPPWKLSSLTSRTWKHTLDQLYARNLVLDPGGLPMPNPRLGALQWLIEEYRSLYAAVPGSVARTAERRPMKNGIQINTIAYGPLHHWGVEAAWRLGDAEPGPNGVGFGPSGSLRPFRAIASSQLYLYLGPRQLDPWDEVFLYCEAERHVVHDAKDLSQKRLAGVSSRAKAFFFAMTTPSLVQKRAFRNRARFYGNEELVNEATAFHRSPHRSPVWNEVARFKTELGVEEGFLARARQRQRHRTRIT